MNDDITYSIQVDGNTFVDFTVEVEQLPGPDYDFIANDIRLIGIDDQGMDFEIDMRNYTHDQQAKMIEEANDAIDNFFSDNAERLLAKHADPEFLEELDKASEYDTYLH